MERHGRDPQDLGWRWRPRGARGRRTRRPLPGPHAAPLRRQSIQVGLYWVNVDDGSVGTRMLGDFAQGRGVFYDRETINGRAVEVRNIYSGATADTYHFEQAFSSDGGKTWETNFIANLTRDVHGASQARFAGEPAAQ